MKNSKDLPAAPEFVAGNGLLHRRALLASGAGLAASLTGYASRSPAHAAPLAVEPWMRDPTAAGLEPYGAPSRYESGVVRGGRNEPAGNPSPGTGSIRTPLHLLNGTITPNGLHHVRLHSGVPDIVPDRHRLLIHGLVERPLIYTLDALGKYPMESHPYFLECTGNSIELYAKEPLKAGVERLHGQISCAEWTGVRVATLLEEVGVKPEAKWILAEGADAAGMARSVPLAKIADDALICLYQNGERLRPSNGYPMRLLLPGYQGTANIKYLRRIKLIKGPAYTRDETARYAITGPDGITTEFYLQFDAKSVITQPAPELALPGPGLYKIAGLAWSGRGRGIIKKVEVSADAGRSWAEAMITSPVMPKALVRFEMLWRWEGQPAILQSRGTDETGYTQWTRNQMLAARGPAGNYMTNCIISWAVNERGELSNVYV